MVFAQRNIAPYRRFNIRNEKNPSALLKSPTSHSRLLTKGAEESIERIRQKLVGRIEMSVSSYDTAWMAMVPSMDSSKKPCFPQCLEWVTQNQHPNGSWGLDANNPSLVKDSLSCTLASILALHKWRVGDQLVQKGLAFLGANSKACNDNLQPSPVGFDIIFPGMICQANELGLYLPFDSVISDQMLCYRLLEIESFRRKGTSLAYVGEGLGESIDWKDIFNHKRSNGSVCNSPATTASSLMHVHDDKCFEYLQSLLKAYEMPTVFPNELFTRLRMVSDIEKLGIHRYFTHEIEGILDNVFRHWQERNEDLFEDVSCTAMAFRLLRMHGYQITSDALLEYVDQEHFMNTTSLQFKDIDTILELYRASKIKVQEKEPILESIDTWTMTFLENKLVNRGKSDSNLFKEVEYTLEYSIHNMDRLVHRRSIELYNPNRIRMMKTSYRCSNIDNRDTHTFAVQDFNYCQAIHRDEVKQLEKWVKDYKLDGLDFDWHWLISGYIHICFIHYAPEQSDVRFLYTVNLVTGVILDDLLDGKASREELFNIVELFEKWDKDSAVYSSERIKTLFNAYYEAFNEFANRAYNYQGRPVKHELLDEFKTFINAHFVQAEWLVNNVTPTFEEYIANGTRGIGIGSYNMHLYLFNKKFSEAAYKSEEFKTMVNLVGKIGRLLNDFQGLERAKTEKVFNAVSLIVKHSNGALTEKDAIKELQKIVESARREALCMLLQVGLVPKEVKECLYSFIKIVDYLYGRGDELRCPGSTFDDINAVIYNPIHLPMDSDVDRG